MADFSPPAIDALQIGRVLYFAGESCERCTRPPTHYLADPIAQAGHHTAGLLSVRFVRFCDHCSPAVTQPSRYVAEPWPVWVIRLVCRWLQRTGKSNAV